jgi:hypothetical protein
MFELKAAEFYAASRNLHKLLKIIEDANPESVVRQEARGHFLQSIAALMPHLEALRAPITWMQAGRTQSNLKDIPEMTHGMLSDALGQISLRLQDELVDRKVFVLNRDAQRFFNSSLAKFGADFPTRFPSAVYEVDEAGKCYALDRSTACVFHLMRTLEVGIKAVARCLGIPDPTKDAQRNWGFILREIKTAIDEKPSWADLKDKDFFSEIHASLDAVRNVWRNATMHVETKYTPDEAKHVFNSVRGFMAKLTNRCDEDGQPAA